jgi:hypothetical protein
MTKYNRKQELLSKIRHNIKRQDCKAVLRIRILLFLGLPDSDLLVRDLKNDVNVTSKSNKQKNFEIFFSDGLKVTEENSRIRTRIRIR